MTDKLEIGRHERESIESMSDFFKRGVMYATLKTSGTTPLDREWLNNSVTNDAMMSTIAFSNDVGNGSRTQLLSGSARIAATTSYTFTNWNWLKSADVGENDGGGASEVDDRTAATLSSKYRWNCLASMLSQGGTRPRPSTASTERHSWRAFAFSASIFDSQNCLRFRLRSARYSRRFACQAAVASGVPKERDDCSSHLTARLVLQHSWSNQRSDERRRMVTVLAGMCRSNIDVASLSYSSASYVQVVYKRRLQKLCKSDRQWTTAKIKLQIKEKSETKNKLARSLTIWHWLY